MSTQCAKSLFILCTTILSLHRIGCTEVLFLTLSVTRQKKKPHPNFNYSSLQLYDIFMCHAGFPFFFLSMLMAQNQLLQHVLIIDACITIDVEARRLTSVTFQPHL